VPLLRPATPPRSNLSVEEEKLATKEQVLRALEGVFDPELHRNLVELGMVRSVEIVDHKVDVILALTTLACPLRGQIAEDVKSAVLPLDDVQEVEVELTEMTEDERRRIGIGVPQKGSVEEMNEIHRVIAVMSGKGGVGKSLVSALLAIALQREGHRVGILDADITGPSIPKMFFAQGARLGMSPVGPVPPRSRSGIHIMSINLLLEQEDMAVIWRGPLVSGAIKQFWGDIFWGVLDYLVVDLPPGTSDASLTVMQSLPMSGIVLVTSPQDLAGMVVRKAANMARQMQTPLLGLVENMSYFACPDTGKHYELFGPSHAAQVAREIGVPLLGQLPIDPEIAKLSDAGHIEDYAGEAFVPIAKQVVDRVTSAPQPAVARP
jgi:ATP-binding protein involved in chromosome partitioning